MKFQKRAFNSGENFQYKNNPKKLWILMQKIE